MHMSDDGQHWTMSIMYMHDGKMHGTELVHNQVHQSAGPEKVMVGAAYLSVVQNIATTQAHTCR